MLLTFYNNIYIKRKEAYFINSYIIKEIIKRTNLLTN